MEELEDKIENEIRNKVFIGCFSRQNFDEGKAILYKYYLKYYTRLNHFETQRLILYNLIVAERMTTNNDTAICNYVKQLKKDMDNIKNYKNEFTGSYCNMLSYYCDCKSINLKKDELLEYYKFSHEYYKSSYKENKDVINYIHMKNMEFNIYKVTKNFKKVLNIVRDLHKISHSIAKAVLKQILEDMKTLNIDLYKESVNIIENTSTNVGCI
ncbi:hypothetical protein [Clostridium sp. ZBS18]|uniref:hypothetical protein n=1 Tax=Clostridium sp. ZBS18 TaxID=2949967 RepID=UPI0020795BA4|nr:hypothetical protein [Clostridium sp. ZBS18]